MWILKNIECVILPVVILKCCSSHGYWDFDMEDSKPIVEIVNNSNDEIWVTISDLYPDTILPKPCGYTWEVKAKSKIDYGYSISREEIFGKCKKLQVFFLDLDEGLPYNHDRVVRRLEFTREELDSCGWTIVYE